MDWIFNVDQIAEWLRSWGLAAAVLSILLNIFISITGILPSIFLSGANAVVFGLTGGFFISLIGEVIGASIAFYLYRLGVNKSKKINKLTDLKWLKQLSESSRMKRMIVLILLRINPLIPSGLVNIAASLTTISFADFMLATLIGKTPAMVFETFVGHDLIYFSENKYRLMSALALGLAAVALLKFKGKTNRDV